MLKSTEHEISTAQKNKILRKNDLYCFKMLRCYIYHVVGILTFISRINFMLIELSMKNILYPLCLVSCRYRM